MKSSELNQRRQQATPRGVGVMCNYFVEKAENATLWDVEGNEVIDFAAGIAVLNTGHRHPKLLPPSRSSWRPLPIRRIRLSLTKAMSRWRSALTRWRRLMARPKPLSSPPVRKPWKTR